MIDSAFCEQLEAGGFSTCFLGLEVTQAAEQILTASGALTTEPYGVRNLLRKVPDLLSWVDANLVPIASQILGAPAFAVRGTYFDKPAESNWAVPWHRDVTIEVEERIETDGFGPWTVKEGIVSVQPPAPVLEGMITLRLHLDPCDGDNGALWVLPGSHQQGKAAFVDPAPDRAHRCDCERAEVLAMRPLLLHASYRSTTDKPRRVLHFDFAHQPLSGGLRWRNF